MPVSRRLVALLAVAAVGAGGLLVQNCVSARRAKQRSSQAARKPEPAPGSASAQEGVASYRAMFRLPPDRRFQRALADVYRIAKGNESPSIEVTWSEDTWELRRTGAVLWRGPVLPTFADLFEMLVTQAKQDLASAPPQTAVRAELAPESAAAFLARDALPVLKKLGEQWQAGARSPELALRAAQRLTELYLQTYGLTEYADPLAARALATLAIARALDPEAGRSEECLLAYLLGHSAHAEQVARTLPASDSIAALVLHRPEILRAAAALPDASHRDRYLNLLSVLEGYDDAATGTEIRRWVARGDFDAAVFGAVSWAPSFGLSEQLPAVALALVASESLHESPPKDNAFAWGMARAPKAERAIAAEAQGVSGPFVDRDVQYALGAARLFEALRGVLGFYAFQLSSRPALQEALAALPAGQSTAVDRFRAWADAWAVWGTAGSRENRSAVAFDGTIPVGAHLRGLMLGRSVATAGSADTPREREEARRMLATLDSRLSHRHVAVQVTDLRLRDQARKDWLQTAIVRDDAPRQDSLRFDLLVRHEGIGSVLRALEADELRGDSLGAALRAVCCNPDVDPARARKTFEKLAKQPELRSRLYYPYSYLLIDRLKDYKTAETWSRAYLADPVSERGLARPSAIAELSRAVRLGGKPEEAWALLEPEVEGQVGDVLIQSIRTLITLERWEDAESVGKLAHERYPTDVGFAAELARAYWRAGRLADATALLASKEVNVTPAEFPVVADRFVRAFEGRPDEQALEAFESLLRAKPEFEYSDRAVRIPEQLVREGRPALAFEMFVRLARFNLALLGDRNNSPGYESLPTYDSLESVLAAADWRIPYLAMAWRAKRAAGGEATADAWLLGLRRGPLSEDVAHGFFAVGTYSLLWTMYPEPNIPIDVSLLRAQAAVLDADVMEQHGSELRAFFAQPSDSFEHRMGRVVLGIETGPEAFAEKLPPNLLCQMEYYLGLAAQSRGELARASDLYQASLATDQPRFYAYRYAGFQLDAWRTGNQAFEAVPVTQSPVAQR
jgi:hypothetical protein